MAGRSCESIQWQKDSKNRDGSSARAPRSRKIGEDEVVGDVDEDDPANHPYVRSLAFITTLTTRQLIFIESSNPKIGLMCFIAIGMTEVSTCQATVNEGDTVQRGDELGMFHFGGSSHTLLFRSGVDIEWFDNPQDGDLIKVRSAIGRVI